MTLVMDVIRLIRSGDFPRIYEIDYMAEPCGASARNQANRFELD